MDIGLSKFEVWNFEFGVLGRRILDFGISSLMFSCLVFGVSILGLILRVWDFEIEILVLGFEVWILEFGDWNFGVLDIVFGIWSLEFGVCNFGIWDFGFGVLGLA